MAATVSVGVCGGEKCPFLFFQILIGMYTGIYTEMFTWRYHVATGLVQPARDVLAVLICQSNTLNRLYFFLPFPFFLTSGSAADGSFFGSLLRKY